MRKKVKFISMFLESHGLKVSAKRVVGISGMLILCVALILTIFIKGATPSKDLISAVELITISALLGSAATHFSKNHKAPEIENEPPE